MWVQGGGIFHGYEAAVSFDGRRYEGFNLANPPARRLPPNQIGDTLIPNRFRSEGAGKHVRWTAAAAVRAGAAAVSCAQPREDRLDRRR